MKLATLLVFAVFAVITVGASAQSTKPAPLTELQTAKIQLAIKDAQLAQKDQQMLKQAEADANNRLQAAAKNVDDTVETVKKELKLDDSWTFNYQTAQFEKKPETKK